jgi:hypothetical protein
MFHRLRWLSKKAFTAHIIGMNHARVYWLLYGCVEIIRISWQVLTTPIVTETQQGSENLGFDTAVTLLIYRERFIHFITFISFPRGPGSSVGIATDYGLDGPVRVRFFAHVQTGPGAHPASCTTGTGLISGVKRPKRGADHTTSF